MTKFDEKELFKFVGKMIMLIIIIIVLQYYLFEVADEIVYRMWVS